MFIYVDYKYCINSIISMNRELHIKKEKRKEKKETEKENKKNN